MTASSQSVSTLLDNISSSLASTISCLPESSSLLPPQDGISLLDLKKELFLSYLQHLVFLLLLKLRKSTTTGVDREEHTEDDDDGNLDERVVKKLVECRIYLEKGVRPLEGRLKYQLDKVLRAADDAIRDEHTTASSVTRTRGLDLHKKGKIADRSDDAESSAASNDGEENEEDIPTDQQIVQIDELSYRPNPSSLLRPPQPSFAGKATSTGNGVYRPPRIQPTSLPTTITTGPARKAERKPTKSTTLDEFISTEYSTAPLAEPSIGSTIVSGGRRNKTQRERDTDAARQQYEEANFVRLPKETKKERSKRQDGARGGGYGGEEWIGLGEGVARIERLTAPPKTGSGRASKLLLSSSSSSSAAAAAKRKADANDNHQSSRQDGKWGEGLEKKRRLLGKRNRTRADYES